jgi:hypothetical protein
VQLTVDSKQEAEFLSRFQAGRQLYNACLNEAMKLLDLVRNSEPYQTARQLPRTKKKERSSAFKKAANKKREIERRKVAYAKTQNRRVVNKILRHGKHIKTENVMVKPYLLNPQVLYPTYCSVKLKMLAVQLSSFLLKQRH